MRSSVWSAAGEGKPAGTSQLQTSSQSGLESTGISEFVDADDIFIKAIILYLNTAYGYMSFSHQQLLHMLIQSAASGLGMKELQRQSATSFS
jgi:hypothetical protein